MDEQPVLPELCAQMAAQRLPRWAELPDLALYMDQLLALMERYLGGQPGFERKGITASMVNNYVKLGVMPPPEKKRYGRTHLSRLIEICLLKPSLPIEAIGQLLSRSLAECDEAAFYDAFCAYAERAAAAAAEAATQGTDALLPPVCAAALRAQAERSLALGLCAGSLPEKKR